MKEKKVKETTQEGYPRETNKKSIFVFFLNIVLKEKSSIKKFKKIMNSNLINKYKTA